MPMFPLGTVLFPRAVLPLHVFEPRYRVLTRRCLEGDGEFGVVLIERGSEVGGGDQRSDVGTVARIVQAAELPDGRFALVATGIERLRVTRWLDDDPYPQAEVEIVAEPASAPGDERTRDAVLARLRTVSELWRQIDASAPAAVPEVADDPLQASFELAARAPIGPFDAQRLLRAGAPSERLELLAEMLAEREQEFRARLALDDGP